MLSYKIVSTSSKPSSKPIPDRKVIRLSDPDYKERVLQRILKSCQYAIGQRAKMKGSRRFGTINKINYNPADIEYDNQGRPLFLEFIPDDASHAVMVGSHQITRKGVR